MLPQRLVQFRDAAQSSDLPELAARFANVETVAAAKIGANVIAAITWLLEKPEYRSLATRLEMVGERPLSARTDHSLSQLDAGLTSEISGRRMRWSAPD